MVTPKLSQLPLKFDIQIDFLPPFPCNKSRSFIETVLVENQCCLVGYSFDRGLLPTFSLFLLCEGDKEEILEILEKELAIFRSLFKISFKLAP